MKIEKTDPKQIKFIFEIGSKVFGRLQGKTINTIGDVLDIIKVLMEIVESIKGEFEDRKKEEPSISLSTSSFLSLEELMAQVKSGEIKRDTDKLNLLSLEIGELAKKNQINDEKVEEYVILGLKVLLLIGPYLI